MRTHIVFTFMAPDKPGLLEQLAELVSAHNGSWLESRLARLGGQFTGIVQVATARSDAQPLQSALLALENDVFKLAVIEEKTTKDNDQANTASPTKQRIIEVLGNDRPGIVHELSRTLIKHHINVDELTSELRSAPMSGELLFDAQLQITVPAEINTEQFEEELEEIADELDLDIRLS
ncbi:MAG: glycine cleavage system protein R [Pseudomonadales bacterium]